MSSISVFAKVENQGCVYISEISKVALDEKGAFVSPCGGELFFKKVSDFSSKYMEPGEVGSAFDDLGYFLQKDAKTVAQWSSIDNGYQFVAELESNLDIYINVNKEGNAIPLDEKGEKQWLRKSPARYLSLKQAEMDTGRDYIGYVGEGYLNVKVVKNGKVIGDSAVGFTSVGEAIFGTDSFDDF